MTNHKWPIAQEGFLFILPLAAIALILWSLKLSIVGGFFSLLTLFVIYFFRDPTRSIPPGEKMIVAPADGKIIQIDPCVKNPFLQGPAIKVSIFMSLFNAHINRIPLTGRIVERIYSPGKFFSANLDKASTANEQNALVIETVEGLRVVLIQIAGLIARRIVCKVAKGDPVIRGQRFGLIRFGSRLDIYLPPNTRLEAQVGQKAWGGQTILGILP